MCDIYTKSLAGIILKIVSMESVKNALTTEDFSLIQREISSIMSAPTDAKSVAEKSDSKPTFSYPCKKILDYEGTLNSCAELDFLYGGSLYAVYYVSPDKKSFVQPIYEAGYSPKKPWLITGADAEKIVGWIPVAPCEYDSVSIKGQWLKKIAENAGTSKGIEAKYNPIFQDLGTIVFKNALYKPADEKPDDEKPDDEKPADEKPADEK